MKNIYLSVNIPVSNIRETNYINSIGWEIYYDLEYIISNNHVYERMNYLTIDHWN